jgi:hypothetical protein
MYIDMDAIIMDIAKPLDSFIIAGELLTLNPAIAESHQLNFHNLF